MKILIREQQQKKNTENFYDVVVVVVVGDVKESRNFLRKIFHKCLLPSLQQTKKGDITRIHLYLHHIHFCAY